MNLNSNLKKIVKNAIAVGAMWLTISGAAWGPTRTAWGTETCFNSYETERELYLGESWGSPNDGHEPYEARDEDSNTRFSTNTPGFLHGFDEPEKFLLVSVGDDEATESYVLTGITIDWHKGSERASNFEIFGWTRHEEDHAVSLFKGKSQRVDGPQHFPLRPIFGHSVIIVFYGNDSKRQETRAWMSINEVKLFGYEVDPNPIAFR